MQNQTYEKQNLLRNTWLCIAFVFLSSLSLYAQSQKVSGTVKENKGEPLPGVTVVVKGSTGGTITDINGSYSLNSVPDTGTLVFFICRNENAGSCGKRKDFYKYYSN